jgi:hypothetical protein
MAGMLHMHVFRYDIFVLLLYVEYKMQHDAIILIYANLSQWLLEPWFGFLFYTTLKICGSLLVNGLLWPLASILSVDTHFHAKTLVVVGRSLYKIGSLALKADWYWFWEVVGPSGN